MNNKTADNNNDYDRYIPTERMITFIDARVRGIEIASQRSRWTLAFMYLLSILMISLAYSESFSWSRKMANSAETEWLNTLIKPTNDAQNDLKLDTFESNNNDIADHTTSKPNQDSISRLANIPDMGDGKSLCASKSIMIKGKCVPLLDENMDGIPFKLREEYLKVWTDSLFFDMPLLGIRFNSSDGGVIGSSAILLFTLVTWFTFRRENHLIYYFVKDLTQQPFSPADRAYARSQIMTTQIFYRGWHDRALESINLTNFDQDVENIQNENSIFPRRLAMFTFWIPTLSILIFIFKDIQSLFKNSPFRPGDSTILDALQATCQGLDMLTCGILYDLFIRIILSIYILYLQYT